MSTNPLKLRYYPFSSLRQKALNLEDFSLAPQYFQILLDIMHTHNGCGLAANQIGLLKRIFVMDTSENKDEPIFCANPIILEHSSETQKIEEGCLSLPGISSIITRPQEILVRYSDENGVTQERTFQGLASSCFQHELDHLNGMLFPDRLVSHASQKIWKKYRPPASDL
jgi:peptide deformylase